MKLKEYLEKYRIKPVEFAVRCGISPASVYAYLGGKAKPHKSTAKRMEKETDGLVKVEELIGESHE